MKENEIKEFLNSQNINFAKQSTIWATIKPTIGAYNNGFGDTMYVMKDHILHFNNEGLAIFAIDDNSGRILKDTLKFFPIQDIKLNLKMNVLGLLLTISTEKGDIEFKIRKSIIGCPWHKENLSFILLGMSAPKE